MKMIPRNFLVDHFPRWKIETGSCNVVLRVLVLRANTRGVAGCNTESVVVEA